MESFTLISSNMCLSMICPKFKLWNIIATKLKGAIFRDNKGDVDKMSKEFTVYKINLMVMTYFDNDYSLLIDGNHKRVR